MLECGAGLLRNRMELENRRPLNRLPVRLINTYFTVAPRRADHLAGMPRAKIRAGI